MAQEFTEVHGDSPWIYLDALRIHNIRCIRVKERVEEYPTAHADDPVRVSQTVVLSALDANSKTIYYYTVVNVLSEEWRIMMPVLFDMLRDHGFYVSSGMWDQKTASWYCTMHKQAQMLLCNSVKPTSQPSE